jgi:chemotaxis protein methyltransferase CheR
MTSEIKETYLNKLISITDNEYELLADFVYTNIGIDLGSDKKTLVVGRLQKILKKYEFSNFTEYFSYLTKDKTGEALSDLADNISTNHTYFYRESAHFEYFLNKFLPEIESKKKKENSNDYRIWCAGCSSGEEAYMLKILMLEHFAYNYNKLKAGLLATDISSVALSKAQAGKYALDSMNRMPPNYVKKYFNRLEDCYSVKEDLKNDIIFRRFNLITPKFSFKSKFDAIFCRNVMIYFDLETRTNLVNKFYDLLNPGGYLFIGHSETILKGATKYIQIQPALYRKEEQ